MLTALIEFVLPETIGDTCVLSSEVGFEQDFRKLLLQ